LIEEWVSHGRYMQLTTQSLLGDFGAKAARFAAWMMERGLVHFIASDAHDPERRPPRLDLARAWVESNYGAAWAQLLFVDHPQAVLDGKPLELKDYPPRKPKPARAGWLARWLGR